MTWEWVVLVSVIWLGIIFWACVDAWREVRIRSRSIFSKGDDLNG